MSEHFYAAEEDGKHLVYMVERGKGGMDYSIAQLADREGAERAAAALNACRNVPTDQLAGLDVAEVLDVSGRLLKIVEHDAPMPSHVGPCGPDAGCDHDCMASAATSNLIAEARAMLAKDGAHQ